MYGKPAITVAKNYEFERSSSAPRYWWPITAVVQLYPKDGIRLISKFCLAWMRSIRVWMRSSRVWMRSS
jgi:hypothetical protein